MRVILHIDVNSAFLAWQALALLKQGEKCDYRTIASVVSGDEKKRGGIVLAKSEAAKKAGIITGEPLFTARRKSPGLKVLKSCHGLYRKYSDELYLFLKKYFLEIECYSIDEVFIDYSSFITLYGEPVEFANKLKAEVKEQLGYTINIGVGNNKFLAKMAGELKKPDAVNSIFDYEVQTKLWPLPVEDMFMVGRKTAVKLQLLGIMTIGDLANYPTEKLVLHFKSIRGHDLKNHALGIDNSQVEYHHIKPKGISKGQTLPKDIDNKNAAVVVVTELVEQVMVKLRSQNLKAGGVSIALKNNYFFTYRTNRKLQYVTDNTEQVTKQLIILFDKLWQQDMIRSITVGVYDLTEHAEHQLNMFEKYEDNNIDQVLDELKSKYGNGIIKKALSKYNDQYM